MKTKAQYYLTICLTVSLMAFQSTDLPQEKQTTSIEKREKLSDFSVFIKKFYYDMTFQKERIVFPCKVKYFQTVDEIPVTEVFTIRNWVNYDRNKEEGIETTIELISHKKVIVHYFVCETCESQYHEFELVGGKWFLVRIMDYSA